MQVEKALSFATEKHKQQKRKNSGEPYVNHCIRVAETVKRYSTDETLPVAALLHDTLEDTDTSVDELKREFGDKVADIVMALTNDKDKLLALGKTEYLAQKINTLTPDELLIKLADRLDNLADLDSSDWAKKYAQQTRHVFFGALDDSRLNDAHFSLLSGIREKIDCSL